MIWLSSGFASVSCYIALLILYIGYIPGIYYFNGSYESKANVKVIDIFIKLYLTYISNSFEIAIKLTVIFNLAAEWQQNLGKVIKDTVMQII